MFTILLSISLKSIISLICSFISFEQFLQLNFLSVPNSISYSLSSISQIVDAPWYSTNLPDVENIIKEITSKKLHQ